MTYVDTFINDVTLLRAPNEWGHFVTPEVHELQLNLWSCDKFKLSLKSCNAYESYFWNKENKVLESKILAKLFQNWMPRLGFYGTYRVFQPELREGKPGSPRRLLLLKGKKLVSPSGFRGSYFEELRSLTTVGYRLGTYQKTITWPCWAKFRK